MPNIKEKMVEVIQSQPDDASYEEIMRGLAFPEGIPIIEIFWIGTRG